MRFWSPKKRQKTFVALFFNGREIRQHGLRTRPITVFWIWTTFSFFTMFWTRLQVWLFLRSGLSMVAHFGIHRRCIGVSDKYRIRFSITVRPTIIVYRLLINENRFVSVNVFLSNKTKNCLNFLCSKSMSHCHIYNRSVCDSRQWKIPAGRRCTIIFNTEYATELGIKVERTFRVSENSER